MTDHETIERQTVTDDGVQRSETIEKVYVPGAPHGDEEAGGAVAGGVAGAVVGAVVGGPVGAVVGGAIGAASGATAGAVDEKAKDDTVVVARRATLAPTQPDRTYQPLPATPHGVAGNDVSSTAALATSERARAASARSPFQELPP